MKVQIYNECVDIKCSPEVEENWKSVEEIEDEIGYSLKEISELHKHSLRLRQLPLLYNTADQIGAKRIVDYGAYWGCSAVVLGFVAQKHGGHVYSIDKDIGHKPYWEENIAHYGLEDSTTFIEGGVPWVNWLELLETIRRGVDYVSIDARHRCFPCLVDFYVWNYFLVDGGRMFFDDAGRYYQHSMDDGIAASLFDMRQGVDMALLLIERLAFMRPIGIIGQGHGSAVLEKYNPKLVKTEAL